MFTHNTRDNSGINPKDKAREIYIWTVEYITHNKRRWGWFDWLVPLQAYKLSSNFLPLPCSLFYQTGMVCGATSDSGSVILLVVSQQTSRWLLHGFCTPLPCSLYQPGMLSRASSDSRYLCLYCWRWQIIDHNEYEWIISKVPLTPGSQPGYKLNCTRQVAMGRL